MTYVKREYFKPFEVNFNGIISDKISELEFFLGNRYKIHFDYDTSTFSIVNSNGDSNLILEIKQGNILIFDNNNVLPVIYKDIEAFEVYYIKL